MLSARTAFARFLREDINPSLIGLLEVFGSGWNLRCLDVQRCWLGPVGRLSAPWKMLSTPRKQRSFQLSALNLDVIPLIPARTLRMRPYIIQALYQNRIIFLTYNQIPGNLDGFMQA
jgi:hypothetical protein